MSWSVDVQSLPSSWRSSPRALRHLRTTSLQASPTQESSKGGLATLGRRLDEVKQEFEQIKRISNSLVEVMASTELDLKKPPTVQRVEAPTTPEKP
jgi:hypothetical protein